MSLTIKNPVRAFAAGLSLLLGCATLSGCNDVAANPPNADALPQFVLRDDANMAGATVAVVSVDGPPADLSARFRQSLDEATAARRIAVAAPAKARYLVRGYLTASPIEGGAEVDVVWDVFTPDKKRAQRLSDEIAVKGAGDDAWAMHRRCGAEQRRRQMRRRSRRLSLQHARGRARWRCPQLRPVPIGLFVVDIRPGSARRNPEVRLFKRRAAAMTPRVRAVQRSEARVWRTGLVRARQDEDFGRQFQSAAGRGDRRLSRRAADRLPCPPLRRPRDLR